MASKHVRILEQTADDAVKIRCRYCDVRESCDKRENKEKYESLGWMTRCTLTPNRPGKKKRK